MLVRLRWFVLGMVTGALGAVYCLFRLRQARTKIIDPDQVVDTVGGAMKSVGRSVRDAWDESREAITEAEDELRGAYTDRRPHLRGVTG